MRGHDPMRLNKPATGRPILPVAAVAIALLAVLGAGGCGAGVGRHGHTVAGTSAADATTASKAIVVPPAERVLRGDEDDDESGPTYTTSSPNDNDADFDDDRGEGKHGYRDPDDASVLARGHAPSAVEAAALAAVAKRYFAAAAARDGAAACALLVPGMASSVPEDYGRPPGPAYLRGASCAAVMTRLFEHERAKYAGATQVTSERLAGPQAWVFVGSRTMTARYLTLEREGRSWRVVGLVGTTLP